ncbi:MAG TPA: DUF2911 domain-containing protein [Sphingobacteriaceae bacterium]|nr:DUF2911 domain-containing protein [Sphingobacteriaceae bacterium]
MKIKLLTVCSLVILAVMINKKGSAQVKIPPASSSQTIIQSLGTSKVTVVYSRPNMSERKVFGELVPYNAVWRTGANQITTITFESEVNISGNKVAAGTYGILTIPNKDKWTVIFTKNSNQWGSYTYNEAEDLLRFEVKPQTLATPVETFTINFSDVMPEGAKMNLSWENTLIEFDILVDEDAEIMASIDEAMKGEKKPYFPAAQYYYKNNKDINKALEWVNKAEEQAPKATYIKYWKGLIQIKAGDKAGAIQTAQKGIEIAKEENNEEYIKLNGQVLEQAKR